MHKRSDRDAALQALAFDYGEKYCAGLRIHTSKARKALRVYEVQADDGSWFETEDDQDITIDYWIFRHRKMADYQGRCDGKRRTTYVATGLDKIEHHATVLHELIHACEFRLSFPFRE